MSKSQGFKKFETKSPKATQNLGKKLAQSFLSSGESNKGALVIGLEGDLGGGKTTFVQGFAKGLGIKEKILSPTFVILKKFKILPARIATQSVAGGPACIATRLGRVTGKNSRFKTFYHIDCYRLGGPKDILDLGFNKIISNPENIIIIEWANKIKNILPKEAIILKFGFIDEKTRKIMLK